MIIWHTVKESVKGSVIIQTMFDKTGMSNGLGLVSDVHGPYNYF